MSLKKKRFVERAIIAAAFVGVAAVGIVVAQLGATNPYTGNSNSLSGVSASLTLGITLDNEEPYAAVIAIPNVMANAEGVETSMTEISGALVDVANNPATGIVGNVGYVAVETNLNGWDLLISTKNGGAFRREGLIGDEENDPALIRIIDYTWELCDSVEYGGVKYPVLSTCATQTEYVSLADGKFLRKPVTGGPVDFHDSLVRFNTLAIGTMRGFEANYYDPAVETWGQLEAMLATGQFSTPVAGTTAANTRAENYVEIQDTVSWAGDDPTTDLGVSVGWVASAAASIGSGVAVAAANDVATSGDLGTLVGATGQSRTNVSCNGVGGTSECLENARFESFVLDGGGNEHHDNYFTAIIPRGEMLQSDVNDAHNVQNTGTVRGWSARTPKSSNGNQSFYNAMIFYINAQTDATLDDLSDPMLNKNGVYTEDLIFTFWAEY